MGSNAPHSAAVKADRHLPRGCSLGGRGGRVPHHITAPPAERRGEGRGYYRSPLNQPLSVLAEWGCRRLFEP